MHDSSGWGNLGSWVHGTVSVRRSGRIYHCFCIVSMPRLNKHSRGTYVVTATISSSSPFWSLRKQCTLTELTIWSPRSWNCISGFLRLAAVDGLWLRWRKLCARTRDSGSRSRGSSASTSVWWREALSLLELDSASLRRMKAHRPWSLPPTHTQPEVASRHCGFHGNIATNSLFCVERWRA